MLVHGYRNPLKNVAKSYKRVEQGLTAAGLVGGRRLRRGDRLRLAGVPDRARILRCRAVGQSLGRHICGNCCSCSAAEALTIDVETHSLGGRVALQSMAFKGDVWVDNLLLTAPAVDDECPEPKQEFNASLESCGRLFVYHSKEDEVLTRAYRLASFDRALGDHGPQHRDVVEASCPNVRVIDCAALVFDHGGYRDIPRVLRPLDPRAVRRAVAALRQARKVRRAVAGGPGAAARRHAGEQEAAAKRQSEAGREASLARAPSVRTQHMLA